MSYADDDLRRASNLIAGWMLKPGADVSQYIRALCLEFHAVRRQAFEYAALTVEACPISADGVHLVSHFVRRDAEIAQRIRGLK